MKTRYFTTYSGVSLPLNLVNELEDDVERRITYFIGYYGGDGELLKVDKMVYGEIEFTHDYTYDAGRLTQAVIMEEDEDPRTLVFDEQGQASEI